MKPIEFFKLQAKNLFRDFQTQTPDLSEQNHTIYNYDAKYFDVDAIVYDFGIDEQAFTLMKAQHIIAQLVGFRKWPDMTKASEPELELAKLIFDNQHKISAEDGAGYIAVVEIKNKIQVDIEDRIGIFKTVFANVEDHDVFITDYRLNWDTIEEEIVEKPLPIEKKSKI